MIARFLGMIALVSLAALGVARGSEPPLPTTTGEHVCSMSYGGRERSFLLHLPPAVGSGRKLPLVLGFHGGGGSGAQFARSSGLPALADRARFIAVFPDGTGRLFSDKLLTWNAGHGCGYARQQKVDDVGFVRALIGRLQAGLPVDRSRIFAAGHSNGAFLAYRLGAELSDLLAAVAPVAGTIGGTAPDGVKSRAPAPAHPVSVVAFHGLLDEHVKYGGGECATSFGVERGRVDLPVRASVGHFVRANGCARTPKVETLSGGKVLRETWGSGREGAEVVLYTLREGGHGWPGSALPGPGAGPATPYLSATGALWRFFEQHPKVVGGAAQAP